MLVYIFSILGLLTTFAVVAQTPIRYTDFDLFHFKGLVPVKNKQIRPYVVIRRQGDSVYLDYCLSKKIERKRYYKLNDSMYYEKEQTIDEHYPNIAYITHRYFMPDSMKIIREEWERGIFKGTLDVEIHTAQGNVFFSSHGGYSKRIAYNTVIDSLSFPHIKHITTYECTKELLLIKSKTLPYYTLWKPKLTPLRENIEEFIRKDFSILPNGKFSFFWHIYLEGRYPE